MKIARVVVDVPAKEIDTAFDYSVPDELQGVEVGSCVLVNFANRPAVAYVVEMPASSEFNKLKPLIAVLGGPYFSKTQADLAQWIATEYVCPLSEAIKLFTPPGQKPKAVKQIDAEGNTVWELQTTVTKGVDDRWVSLTEDAETFQPSSRASMQRAIISGLSQGPVRVVELSSDLGSVNGALKKLEALGVVQVEHRRRLRTDMPAPRSAPRHVLLTQGQQDALVAIATSRATGGGVVVCDGVTGSGKTEVYLRAIEEVLAEGKSACVLVPEISLTPQTVGRFRSRFGDMVAVLHSRLSTGERFDQWEQIANKSARVVVGARSALFAPMDNLGLIIIDEEHENSYKQSSAPRYHARDVAAKMAHSLGITLVLGSASPSLETQQKCLSGEWVHVSLPQRASGKGHSPVSIVDMATEFKEGHRSMFSRELTDELLGIAQRKEKAVLFLNRRGFASFLLCRECGYVPRCDNCSTSLTYHEQGQKLVCHHCGTSRPVPAKCPECESPYLRQFGAGTQRVEAELQALLPDTPIIRMDADSTKGKGAHEARLLEFESFESAVLLGTQMIAKGLDYPDVTLVGVVNADTTLNMPDFRAGERTWQLLEQVAGRAGRGEKPGKVIIQTYWASHPALLAVAQHDRELFNKEELEVREELNYPPYGRLANVLFWGKNNETVGAKAKEYGMLLRRELPDTCRILGPSPCVLSKLKSVYRWSILVKTPANASWLPSELKIAASKSKKNPEVSIAIDIDPTDLL